MASRKIAFIVNPNAAMGTVEREWPRIRDLAKHRLGEFQAFLTAGPRHATTLTRRALQQGSEVVICVGGDGTLNEVVNGFMGEDGPLRPEAMLGFIPRGTGCDFIKTIPLPKAPETALDIIKDFHARHIDLGRISYRDRHGNPSLRYFHNVTSFGLGGEVDDRVNRTTKAFGGFVSFIWATLISILIYDKKRIHLKVDEGFSQTVVCWNVAVANGQYHGGGMWVAPEARVDDGMFHVTMIGDFTLPEVFWNLPRLYNGTLIQHEKVTTLVGKSIEASSEQRVLLDVDGEQPGQLPVTIDIVPGAVSLITPP
ncbi:MAG: diacylglycerol kinase family lipid kinase [Deltaproteobacteria bacterium]|nr:diacylglycerol kinase family lipid kinase [Deltaproteobacteria bacterium]MBW2077464.1 diacylglycerol kinase family lipid kinase [Deltaproteobacteria bacterium]